MRHVEILGKKIFSWGSEPEKSNIKSLNSTLYDTPEDLVKDVSLVMMRKIALREPFFMKGCTKKNMDVLRNGLEIKPLEENKRVDATDKKVLYEFEQRTNFFNKLFIAGVCSNIYGTGFLEPIFKEELLTDVNVEKKPDEDFEIYNLSVINPEFIKRFEQKTIGKKQFYWVYEEMTPNSKKFIHPDRLIPVITDSLPFSRFGISKIHLLYNILLSKMNADRSAGEMLAWSSTGIQDMTIQDMDDEQEKKMHEIFLKHPSAFVHDQDYVLKVENPNRIDPKPYYDYIISNIAAAFNMPINRLLGNDTSDVETSMADYIHDCENIQENTFTPIVARIYKNIIESKGKKWKYYLDWNQIYVNELSEAKILQTRTYTVTQCYDRNIIDTEEARKILNEGAIYLDPTKEIKVKPVQEPTDVVTPSNPNIEPQPTVKKPTIRSLTQADKDMIARFRELGEKELVEQEKRISEAKKNGK